jgi:hypothetical protein
MSPPEQHTLSTPDRENLFGSSTRGGGFKQNETIDYIPVSRLERSSREHATQWRRIILGNETFSQ